MAPRLGACWKRASEAFLDRVGDLYKFCDSICFGATAEGAVVRVVASPGLIPVLSQDHVKRFLKRMLLGQRRLVLESRLGSIEFEPVGQQQLVKDLVKSHQCRVATIVNMTASINERYPDGAFVFYAVHRRDLSVHSRSSVPGIFDFPVWREVLEKAIESIEEYGEVVGSNQGQGHTSARSSVAVKRHSGPMPKDRAVHDMPKRQRKVEPDGSLVDTPGSLPWYVAMLAVNLDMYVIRVSTRTWVLPEYDVLKGEILKKHPVQVTVGEDMASFQCSCATCKALSFTSGVYNKCVHIRYVHEGWDRLHTMPVPTTSVVAIQPKNARGTIYCYWVEKSFVYHAGKGLRCMRTTHGSQCACVNAVRKYLDGNGSAHLHVDSGANNNFRSLTGRHERVEVETAGDDMDDDDVYDMELGIEEEEPYSVALEYPPSAALVDAMHTVFSLPVHHSRQYVPLQPRLPQVCQCGLEYMEGSVRIIGECTIHLPEPLYSRRARLCHVQCPNCCESCTIKLDDREALNLGMFRYTDQTFISLRMLYSVLDQVIIDGRTIQACFRSHIANMKYKPSCVDAAEFCSASTFRRALNKFFGAIQRQYCFSCTLCNGPPRIVICDGTTETMYKKHYIGQPVTHVKEGLRHAKVGRVHTRWDRSALGVPCFKPGQSYVTASNLVCRFAKHVRSCTCHEGVCTSDNFDITDEGDALLFVGQQMGAMEFLSWLYAILHQLSLSQRSAIAALLHALGGSSPVVAYLPKSVADQLEPLFSDESVQHAIFTTEHEDCLRRCAPLVSNVLDVVKQYERGDIAGEVPRCLYALFSHLIGKSKLCVSGEEVHEAWGIDVRDVASCHSQSCLASRICTGLVKVRDRRSYSCDGKDDDSELHTGPCKHSFQAGSHGSQKTGGIFTFFCPHGVCIGYFIMPRAEGRNEAFSFLTCYFEYAPDLVIYDFACQLQEYCLNREPVFFANTVFLVDRFHWDNHTTCSRSYNMSLYEWLADLNSQIAEQWNSGIKRLKSTVSQMAQTSFMFLLRLYLDERNKARNIELEKYKNCLSTLSS